MRATSNIVVVVVATAVAVLVVVTTVSRYDNFTFIDRSERTTLYLSLPLHPFLSSVFLSLSLSPSLPQPAFLLSLARSPVRSRVECSLALCLQCSSCKGDTGVRLVET